MTDTIPQRLRDAVADRYRLHRELGEGGMATVYLADDLKHDRKVAVKVLRPELAAVIGGERFITEIKTTAALQHPHILPLFDSGEADGFLYYVMPYVEGESLRARLDRERQLEVDEALHITRAVASALQYAHERDIVHRDIKPENILIHAGEPVVADFGIALALSAAGGGRMTETGLSLGTPHYMSPEQAAADRELTPRADVYSLTCVLYEMLAGQPPHTGPTPQSVLVRIMTEEPRPVSDARPTVPSHVRAAIAKGLEKLPADRFGSAEELREALDDPNFSYQPAARPAPTGATAGVTAGARETTPAGTGLGGRFHAVATLGLAATVGWLVLGDRGGGGPAADLPVMSFVAVDSAQGVDPVAVGPDGALLYLSGGRIHVRPSGELEATPIPDLQEVNDFALSPDGDWVAFSTSSGRTWQIRKVQTGGGSVANVWRGEGLAITPWWSEDGWIYFVSGPGSPRELRRVRDVGGEAETLLELGGRFVFHPRTLPGDRALLFTVTNTGGAEGRVMLYRLESGDTAEVVPEGFDARWSPTGHVIYAHASGALWALPFDLDRLEATGEPVPILDGLGTNASFSSWALGSSGTLAFVSGAGSGAAVGGTTFKLMDEAGNAETLPIEPTDHPDARVSPDGGSLAYIRAGDVWVFDLDRGSNYPLTEGSSGQHNPIWSPDGTRIVYRAGDDLMVRPVDGSAESSPVTSTAEADNPMVWLEDGTVLIGTEGARSGDIIAVNVENDDPPRRLLDANWQERGATISPDGRWIAYSSSRDGSPQLYVRSWPDLRGETLVSTDEGQLAGVMYPQWSPDGRTLYYQKGNRIHAADVETAGGFAVTGTRTLFEAFGVLQDIHPDGRLLVAGAAAAGREEDGDAPPSRLVVATNWFTELRTRLGGG